MIHYRKVGGIRFLRVFRLQFTFCVCRKASAPARMERPVADRSPRLVSLVIEGQRVLTTI